MDERRTPQGDARILLEAKRARQSQHAALPRQRAVAPGERRRIAGQGDERRVAAQCRNRGRGGELVEGQDVAVVVTQDVVRGQRRFTNGARLRTAIRAKIGLLHRAYEPARGWSDRAATDR